VITECAIPTPASGTCHIAAGADGALWFTESGPNQIGRITVSGAFKEFPHSGDRPGSISVGPDGALWFTEFNSQQAAEARIGRITTSGVITEYAAFAGQNGVTVQVVEAVFSNDGAGWALRCDRMAALR
jgi:virginiamycin B lyase